MSRNPSRDSQKGTFTIHSPVNPAQRISLAEIQEAASPLSASSPETLQEATLRYPLPLRRTPHGDRDRIGGVKVKPKSPRSTLPAGYHPQGSGGATPQSSYTLRHSQGQRFACPCRCGEPQQGDRDCIGGVKAKSALPRSTLPNRHRMRGVQGGAPDITRRGPEVQLPSLHIL